jgi:hypothetical protein
VSEKSTSNDLKLRGKAQHGAASLRFLFADAALALRNRSRAVRLEQFKAAKGDCW